MLHATYQDELIKVVEHGLKPGTDVASWGRIHVHMACIVLGDEPSNAALQHVPGGQSAMVILLFSHSQRKARERTALPD